jgi:hypothetical protein
MDFDLQVIEGQKSLVSEKHRRKTVLFFRSPFCSCGQRRWINRGRSGKLAAYSKPSFVRARKAIRL